MQHTSKEIYNSVSQEKNIPLDIVKLVGDAVFQEWDANIRNPKSIVLKIKKLGRMYLRKNRMERELLRRDLAEEKKDVYRERLKEYERYISKKKEIQALRREVQPLIPKQEDELD